MIENDRNAKGNTYVVQTGLDKFWKGDCHINVILSKSVHLIALPSLLNKIIKQNVLQLSLGWQTR